MSPQQAMDHLVDLRRRQRPTLRAGFSNGLQALTMPPLRGPDMLLARYAGDASGRFSNDLQASAMHRRSPVLLLRRLRAPRRESATICKLRQRRAVFAKLTGIYRTPLVLSCYCAPTGSLCCDAQCVLFCDYAGFAGATLQCDSPPFCSAGTMALVFRLIFTSAAPYLLHRSKLLPLAGPGRMGLASAAARPMPGMAAELV
jgi:hypothetical protein